MWHPAFASLSNAPITYMGLILAGAFARYGGRGMLLTEAGASVLGIIILIAVATALRAGSKPPVASVAV